MGSEKRINKTEFISKVAARSGLPVRTVNKVYEAMRLELFDAISSGRAVVLMGLGRFYRQQHRGHKAHFGQLDIPDYPVLKFSASRHLNHRLAAAQKDNPSPQAEGHRVGDLAESA